MKRLKKLVTSALALLMLFASFGAAACKSDSDDSTQDDSKKLEKYEQMLKEQDHKIQLSVWTYYNNKQSAAFEKVKNTFNNTVGKEKNIYIVDTPTFANVSKLTQTLNDAFKKDSGKPNIFQIYSDDLKSLDDTYKAIASLDDYFTESESDSYVDSFFEDGYINDGLKLIPTAKSTEVFMLNKTDWDRFAAGYNAAAEEKDKVSLDSLKTIEGITATAEKYYRWSNGKALFGRDALANYILTSARSLGRTVIQPEGEQVKVVLDKETFRRIYDNFYVPYVKGHFYAQDRFRSGDVKTGKILSYVGSTSSVSYFPASIQVSDDSSYPIETYVAPTPVFENGKKVAIQQGAGLAVTKTDEVTEYASCVFIKYLSENIDFAAAMNYVPVLKTAYGENSVQKIQTAVLESEWEYYLQKNEKKEEDFTESEISEIKTNIAKDNQVILDTYAVTYETMQNYEIWASFPYENSAKIRTIFEYALAGEKPAGLGMDNLKNGDDLLAAVNERVKNGETHDAAAAAELAAYTFDDWYNELVKIIGTLSA